MARRIATFVHAPPLAVFAQLADLSHHPRWCAGIAGAEAVSHAPVGDGAGFAHLGKGRLGRQRRFIVTQYTPPDRIAWRARRLGLPVDLIWDMVPQSDGTELSLTIAAAGWLRWLTAPLIERLEARQWAEPVDSLRRYTQMRSNPHWRERLGPRVRLGGRNIG